MPQILDNERVVDRLPLMTYDFFKRIFLYFFQKISESLIFNMEKFFKIYTPQLFLFRNLAHLYSLFWVLVRVRVRLETLTK